MILKIQSDQTNVNFFNSDAMGEDQDGDSDDEDEDFMLMGSDNPEVILWFYKKFVDFINKFSSKLRIY